MKDERDAQADRRSKRLEDEAKSCAQDDSDFKPIVGTRLRPSEAALSVKYGYVWNCPPASFYSEGRAGEDGEKEGAGMVYRVKKKAFFGDVGGDGVPGGQRRGRNNRSNAEKRDAHATPMEASRPVKPLTSAAVDAQKEGATGRSVGQQQQGVRDHLDDENVRLVVEAIPRACDGRILVEHEMASIIGKRSDGLRERIASMDENPPPESHLVKENARKVWGQTREAKVRAISGCADAERQKLEEAQARRQTQEEERIEKLNLVVRRREIRLEESRAKAALDQLQWRQKWMLSIVQAALAINCFHGIVERYRESLPHKWATQWAARVITRAAKMFLLRKQQRALHDKRSTFFFKFQMKVRDWNRRLGSRV